MTLILGIPLEIRLTILFVVGALVGGQINRAIYGLVYPAVRRISPWLAVPPAGPKRDWLDRVPILGWLRLRRETKVHGAGFWVRPLLIELACAIGFAWFYSWEIRGGLVPTVPGIKSSDAAMLHWQYLLHVVLIVLMTAATFIDFDEQIIPDEITVPGTVFALVFAAVVPLSRLPVLVNVNPLQPKIIAQLHVTSMADWPDWFDRMPGLLCGLACLLVWCWALLPKRFPLRYGPLKATRFCVASIMRPRRKTHGILEIGPRKMYPETILLAVTAVLGSCGIAAAWFWGGVHWQSLFSSLLGLAFGGGLIWAVRIIGSSALGKEAMGFGDVTLLAMIGAFLGWQPALMIFFLAPFTAVLIAIVQFLVTRRSDIAFGPYLCASTLILLLGWQKIWNGWADQMFRGLGMMIPAMVGVCLILMWVMLFGWQYIKQRILAHD